MNGTNTPNNEVCPTRFVSKTDKRARKAEKKIKAAVKELERKKEGKERCQGPSGKCRSGV